MTLDDLILDHTDAIILEAAEILGCDPADVGDELVTAAPCQVAAIELLVAQRGGDAAYASPLAMVDATDRAMDRLSTGRALDARLRRWHYILGIMPLLAGGDAPCVSLPRLGELADNAADLNLQIRALSRVVWGVTLACNTHSLLGVERHYTAADLSVVMAEILRCAADRRRAEARLRQLAAALDAWQALRGKPHAGRSLAADLRVVA